jgi:hypothetical protein
LFADPDENKQSAVIVEAFDYKTIFD